MPAIDPATCFWLFLRAALLSTGGLGSLPSLHESLLSRHWATDADFAAALAVGQTAPGPTGLWMVSLGFLVAGWWGAGLATLAAVLPPLLILPIEALHRRLGSLPAVADFVQGLSLAIVAIFPIVLLRLVAAQGADVRTALIVLICAALILTRRLHPVLVLALAAMAGEAVLG
jgi:chromate transporter